MTEGQKHIIVSVTNDLVADQRVHKICTYLLENNYRVLLVGRLLPGSLPVSRSYDTKRLRLLFKKGPLFYAFFNLRLFFFLLFRKCDLLLSNDLDTLLPNYLVSKIKSKQLIYDSHEYFTEVPELNSRPKIKAIWEGIEKRIFPKLKNVYTVNESLARVYSQKYGVPVRAVLNLPYYKESPEQFKNEDFTVIYQGSLNKDRGLEELVLAFQHLEKIRLWIIGGGDVEEELKQLVQNHGLEKKIRFFGKMPFAELNKLTARAHLGASLEKPTNLSYAYATPNKVFDYIANHLPILASSLPEIKKIVENYRVGMLIGVIEPEEIARKIQYAFDHPQEMKNWSEQAALASKELCWEKQLPLLDEIFLS